MSYRATQFQYQAALAGLGADESSGDEEFEEEAGRTRLWLAKWPNGDGVLCKARSQQEVFRILDEEGDPGAAVVKEYHGPLVLEFRSKLPGRRVDTADYCRLSGPLPQPDALRRQLWAQREEGTLCDICAAAADGAARLVHRCVLAAACPSLAGALAAVPREEQIELPGVPTAAVLDAVLRWLYVEEPPFDRGQSVSPRELLPAALALGLDRLAEECDYEIASRMRGWNGNDAEGAAAAIRDTIELLAFADRHNRPRLSRFAVWLPLGNCWRQLRAAPGFDALPGPVQRAALAVASQQPPRVRRQIGQPGADLYVPLSVPAKEYQAAGGQLTAEEEHELVEWEQLQLWQAQQAAAGGGAAAALRQQQLHGGPRGRMAGGAAGGSTPTLPPAYEVTAADIESSSIEVDYPSLPWDLSNDGDYEDRGAVFDALTQLAHPHLAAELQRQRDDGEQDEAAASERLCAAILQVAAAPEGGERAARVAALVVAAERGDRQAAIMLKMGTALPRVLPGI